MSDPKIQEGFDRLPDDVAEAWRKQKEEKFESFCPVCQHEVADEDNFCPKCGHALLYSQNPAGYKMNNPVSVTLHRERWYQIIRALASYEEKMYEVFMASKDEKTEKESFFNYGVAKSCLYVLIRQLIR